MRRIVGILFTVLAASPVAVVPARADLVVTVGNATIPLGGVGTVDVLIRSTNPAGDPLSSFGFEFLITPVGPRHLDFRNPQLDTQLALPSYVFAGDSGDVVDKVPVGVVHSVSGGTNNQFVGGDETDSGGNVLVKGDALLVRLDLTAASTTPPSVGDTFTVALQPGAFTDFRDANNTLVPFTSTSGLVTIGAISAVPEPQTAITLTAAVALALLVLARRARESGAGGLP